MSPEQYINKGVIKMIKYTIDKENGIVKATIEGCANDVVNRLSRVMACEAASEKGRLRKAATISDVFCGVAKCHPEDNFDEAVGIEIARKRMLDKYHTARVKALNRVDAVLDNEEFIIMNEIQKVLKTCRNHG